MARSVLVVAFVIVACSKTDPAPTPTRVSASAAPKVPPVLVGATPAEGFADASSIDGKTAYDQARTYEESGQHWLARLVLEKKALGSDGTRAELELLAAICHEQGDDPCVEACSARLGRKLVFEAGAPRPSVQPGEHQEPTSDAARARDLLLKHRLVEARRILEPKVVDGKSSPEEVRLLRSLCQEQADRMCVALCDTRLAQ